MRLSTIILALFSLTLLVAPFSVSAATRVFSDGFESGNTDLWGQDDPHNRCNVVSTAADGVLPSYAGTKMARCNWDDGVYESLVTPVDYANEFLLRTHLRVDENLERTNGSATKIMRFFNWHGDFNTYLDLYGSLRPDGVLGNEGYAAASGQLTTYWGGLDNASDSLSWHEVEYYINQSQGAIKVWHDGVQIRNETGLDFNGARWTPFYLTSNWGDAHDAVNYIYFDDFEIFSDDTGGTPATGLMSDATIQVTGSDTTAPDVPSGLAVQ